MIDPDSVISAAQAKGMMNTLKSNILSISGEKSSATKEKIIILNKKNDLYLSIMKKLVQLEDLYDRIEKIKLAHPKDFSDNMTEHGVEYADFQQQVRELSREIALEYNARHNVT